MIRRWTLAAIVLCFAFTIPVVAAQTDVTGCKDHPLFTRMPGYWIHNCKQNQFDAHPFFTAKAKTTSVEGPLWSASYYPQSDLNPKPSEVQIRRNFENAVKKLGGAFVASDKGHDTYRIAKDGKEFWVDVTAEFTGKYGLCIVEKGGMAQDVVANAGVFSNDIRSTGHAAVYGIHFDSGKAEIKPDSAATIAEIAKLLTGDAALKLYVVGHTDNVGSVEANLKLSQQRAEAVLQVLVRDHGIAAQRLRAFGCAQFAPVASNQAEEGRAQNRRVELVAQ
jgi:OmpA-OmpF porin, OOP family